MNSGCFIIVFFLLRCYVLYSSSYLIDEFRLFYYWYFENIGWFGFSLKMGMMVLFNLFDLDLLRLEGCWVCAILVLNRLVMVTWMSQNCTSPGIDVSQIDHRMEKSLLLSKWVHVLLYLWLWYRLLQSEADQAGHVAALC